MAVVIVEARQMDRHQQPERLRLCLKFTLTLLIVLVVALLALCVEMVRMDNISPLLPELANKLDATTTHSGFLLLPEAEKQLAVWLVGVGCIPNRDHFPSPMLIPFCSQQTFSAGTMRSYRRLFGVAHCVFVLIVSLRYGNAWSPLSTDLGSTPISVGAPKGKPANNLWKYGKTTVIHSAFAASLLCGSIFLPLEPAGAAADNPALGLGDGLSAASEYQPQIKFSGNRPNQGPSARGPQILPQKVGESPILQGLIYVDRPDSRPNFADTLVITAGSAERPDDVLAGAKIPVTMARFPMQFSMYQANIARGKEDLWSKAVDGDIIVTARVCPEETTLPCSDGESTYKARGISKIIRNLPGMDEGTVVRTAISLPLR